MYCTKRNMAEKAISAIPPPPRKFTVSEWYLTHNSLTRTCFDHQRYSDSILRESESSTNMVLEKTKSIKAESDHQVKVKSEELEFYKGEVEKSRKELLPEIESSVVYIDRLGDARSSIEDALDVCKKCSVIRDSRTGIDSIHDDVQKTLSRESEVIRGVQELLKRSDGQMSEQLRGLRAVFYSADRNLEDKVHALKIEERNSKLDTGSINLYTYHGRRPLDPASITSEQWMDHTKDTIEEGLNKLASSRQTRLLMEVLMKQVAEDLVAQRTIVNDAIYNHSVEVKESKSFSEERHSDIARKCREMMENIRKLQQAIKNEEPFMALSHTRLGNRAQRRNAELVRDRTETQSAFEVSQLHDSVARSQQLSTESQASSRYLLKTQSSSEEQINVKTVSIKVDEVECSTLRQRMDYFKY